MILEMHLVVDEVLEMVTKYILRQMGFNKDIGILSSGFKLVYDEQVQDEMDDTPLYVMERYVDYMFNEFNKSNFEPMRLFLDFCEKNTDDGAFCELIRITFGESLICVFTDKIYHDYVEKTAGLKTKKCLESVGFQKRKKSNHNI
jgi:hypothetical protein